MPSVGANTIIGKDGAPKGAPPPAETFHFELEDGSGVLLLEDGAYLLLEEAP